MTNYGLANPITAQARRLPALPVFSDSAFLPLPRSSRDSWITIDLPMTLSFEQGKTDIPSRLMDPFASPRELALMLPMSPACRRFALGPPWVLPEGSKCAQAFLQPSLRSPYWCMWNPCIPRVRPEKA